LLEEDLLERLDQRNDDDDDDDESDESVASYIMSRRSSYTDSLPPFNRVCLVNGVVAVGGGAIAPTYP